jgi:hypothetical protein
MNFYCDLKAPSQLLEKLMVLLTPVEMNHGIHSLWMYAEINY